MGKLRVAITTSDLQACGMLRVRWPAQVLTDRGEIEIIDYEKIQIECSGINDDGSIEVVGIVDPPDADVLVLQRPAEQVYADSIPFYQELGIAVVVDIDDDLQHLPSNHPQHKSYNQNMTGWKYLKRACSMADVVVASTPGIAKNYASHGRVHLVRNCVPQHYLDIGAQRDGHTVGWGGTVKNHPGDLEVTRGGVGLAIREVSARFRVVGLKEDVRKSLWLDEELGETGIVEFLEYPHLVAHLDVGIAPLAENRYNWQGKSWLKVLEYSALGVPWVASPQPEYLEFVRQADVGCIAKDRSRDWHRAVLRLLREPSLREEEGQRGREFVRDNLLIEDNSWRWLDAWQAAVDRRRAVAA
jgi:glycosyltransferase involved in cell wall biosynthesis